MKFITSFFAAIIKFVLLVFIRAYQWFVSPILGSNCRYLPTCSQYAIESLETHGPFKGFWLTLKRVIRCHPWGGDGYDPVPPPGNNQPSKQNADKISEKAVAESQADRYTERAICSHPSPWQELAEQRTSRRL